MDGATVPLQCSSGCLDEGNCFSPQEGDEACLPPEWLLGRIDKLARDRKEMLGCQKEQVDAALKSERALGSSDEPPPRGQSPISNQELGSSGYRPEEL